jgi:hypothetical protein
MDVTITLNYTGEFDTVRTKDLPVTGRDGYGEKTPRSAN